jgi:hypothetical protein
MEESGGESPVAGYVILLEIQERDNESMKGHATNYLAGHPLHARLHAIRPEPFDACEKVPLPIWLVS